MEVRLARERVGAVAEGRRQPPGRGPQRRRRRRERLAALDAVAHRLEPCLEQAQQVAQHAEGGFRRRQGRGDEGARRHGWGGGPAHGAVAHHGGQLLHRVLDVRIERRALADLLHRRLQQRHLRGQLARGRAVALVFHDERHVGAAQIGDFRPRAPAGPKAHEHGQREDSRDDSERRSQGYGEAAHDARRAVGDQKCVASRGHSVGPGQSRTMRVGIVAACRVLSCAS